MTTQGSNQKKIKAKCSTFTVKNTFQKCDQCGYTAFDLVDMKHHFYMSQNKGQLTPIGALSEIVINMVIQGNNSYVKETIEETFTALLEAQRQEYIAELRKNKKSNLHRKGTGRWYWKNGFYEGLDWAINLLDQSEKEGGDK